jgi:hypothetical protein
MVPLLCKCVGRGQPAPPGGGGNSAELGRVFPTKVVKVVRAF